MSLEDRMAPSLHILQVDFGPGPGSPVSISFIDADREHQSVSEIRQLLIDPAHERFAGELADVLESLRHLVVEAEDVRRGTPLTRR